MRLSSLYLVPTLATAVVLGAACALPAASSRPAWFTTGGPLYGILDDPPPFSPVVWKRRCLGVTWLDQQPTGEWLGCAGFPFGPRLEYQSLTDTQPWTPSPAGVTALESMLYKLNPILYRGGANTERRKPLRLNVNDYHRQYSGLQIAGRRFIYVNALHIRSVDEEWRTKILAICDGGYAAWGALYDPSAQEFLNFSVNGVA